MSKLVILSSRLTSEEKVKFSNEECAGVVALKNKTSKMQASIKIKEKRKESSSFASQNRRLLFEYVINTINTLHKAKNYLNLLANALASFSHFTVINIVSS
jgi:hypothetical protein